MAQHSHPRSSTRKALVVILVIVTIIVAGLAVFALWVRTSINSQIRHIPLERTPTVTVAPQSGAEVETPQPVNFLILGSDSRASGGDPTNWQAGAQRSDVMMVAQLSGDRQSLSLMSIPRDSWVNIPGQGIMKINAAYSLGGADLAMSTVEQLLNVPMHHFMVIDFQSFADLTDQFGGVTIPTAGGQQTFNGEEALTFVRERKGLPNGDFDRQRRHQAWIKAVMGKIFDGQVLANPSEMSRVMTTILQHSAVDSGLTADSLLALGLESRNLRPSKVEFFTAPYTGTGTSNDGQSIVLLNDEALAEVAHAFATDTVASYVKNNPNIVSLDSGYVN